MKNQSYDRLLNLLTWGGDTRYSVIAGGAVRDWLLGREVKDIDVWVPAVPGMDYQPLLEKVYGPVQVMPTYTGRVGVERVYHGGNLEHDGLPVQVIEFSEYSALPAFRQEVVDQFDFGLCRAGYGLHGLMITQEFLADVENHRFTLLRCDDQSDFDRSTARYNRLRQKYPGYTLDAAAFVKYAMWQKVAEMLEELRS